MATGLNWKRDDTSQDILVLTMGKLSCHGNFHDKVCENFEKIRAKIKLCLTIGTVSSFLVLSPLHHGQTG